ncbi:MAG: type II toxin-antitoxin system VapC family toxin [Phycisphaerae bacterium]
MVDAAVRVYADTSVFGGVFDEEFREPSRRFFAQVRDGRFALVTSAVVQEEVSAAPEGVRAFFDEMLPLAEVADIDDDALQLQSAYIKAGILGPRWALDALHVALATVSRASVIVSWNFAHIVHFDRIRSYNRVNQDCGFRVIAVHSPREVIRYENETL